MPSQISILGNKIDCLPGYDAFYDYLKSAAGQFRNESGYITVNNVHTMIEGFRDAAFRRIINEGYMAIPDGKPLQVMGRLKGNKEISRLFGPTVMERFIDWGRKDGRTHFFLGSSVENLEKLRKAIETKYPGTKIAGMISPPFKPFDQWDNDHFVTEINKARPDFIWIGLGAPKQERWMYENHRKIHAGILFGIGAGFDYLAGNTQHAPEWMKKSSLEWAYRLMQEPKRLWKRYLTTIPAFIFFGGLELIGIKFRKAPSTQQN